MAKKKNKCYCGIGGQAVLEGIMMKNKEKYAVAVRKPDGEIAIELENHQGLLHGNKIKELPFVRGIFNFIDSLVLGMKVLNFSASFYDEEEDENVASRDADKKSYKAEEQSAAENDDKVEEQSVAEESDKVGEQIIADNADKNKAADKKASGTSESLLMTLTTIFSVVLAVGIFVVLPYFISSLFEEYIRNRSLMAIIEGVIRILIFILYVWGISAMKDIKRVYQYHGAEHKCINCIEKGKPLTVQNVMKSSRLHKRCGTSFMFFVMFVSIILFFFIRVDNVLLRVGLRILLMPVVAGISYEIIRLAGRTDNILVQLLSAPGMMIQRMTTKEPDESMAEVAIVAVEAVFDWKKYLHDNFGYEEDDTFVEEGSITEEEL